MTTTTTASGTNDRALMAVVGVVYLRTPVLPRERAAAVRTDDDPAADDDGAAAGGVLRAIMADPLVGEAIAVSSDSLASVLRRLDAGRAVEPAELRRAAFAACRYLLRMTGRPTPFGLMAGVAVGRFGESARAVIGTGHRKGARPDAGWLSRLVDDWQVRPDVLRRLRVCTNDLCFERGGRFVLPYVPVRDDQAADEMSVLATPPARIAVQTARTPLPFPALADRIARSYPQAGRDRIEGMLTDLVRTELLLTDLRPPQHCTDPIPYILSIVDRPDRPDRSHRPDGSAETDDSDRVGVHALGEVDALLRDYAHRPLGAGHTAWRAATEAMGRFDFGDQRVQVDLRTDADVTLPAVVAREIEDAASALLRIAPGRGAPPHLADYHQAFVSTYGLGNAVAVLEVLDAERGLGPPAGYQVPATSRLAEPSARGGDLPHRRLAELAQEALLSESGEVVLDDGLVAELGPESALPPPRSAEMCVQLLAASTQDVDRGDFRLVTAPAGGSGTAGAMFGRFAYLFPESTPLADAFPPRPDGQVHAQLAFRPLAGRTANVALVPNVLDTTLAVGVFAERDDPAVLGLDDIAIVADTSRLSLVCKHSGETVTVVSPHVLDTRQFTPNVVRLLREIAQSGTRQWSTWQWGDVACLPHLPRVRYGRTVLAPARWRPPREVTDTAQPWPRWNAAVARWRERWRVPATVQVRLRDRSLELDLDRALHRRLLHDELRRTPDLTVTEPPWRDEAEFGWLQGHANEIVVPLVATRHSDRGAAAWAPASERVAEPPGGQWLYAKLYSSPQRQQEILAEQLPRLLASLPSAVDRWFFLRYADPDTHLRIRFHGPATAVNEALLPALHDWAAQLRAAGLIRKLVLDTYEPETDRYGGPAVIEAAERAFHADSEAALSMLELPGEDLPEEVLVAVNFADLLGQLCPQGTAWYAENLLEPLHYQGMHRHVRAAVELLDDIAAADAPYLTVIRDAWKARSTAIREYGQLLRDTGVAQARRGTAFDGLLHMHHNRLVGIDPDLERRAHSVTNRVAAAHRGRARVRA